MHVPERVVVAGRRGGGVARLQAEGEAREGGEDAGVQAGDAEGDVDGALGDFPDFVGARVVAGL